MSVIDADGHIIEPEGMFAFLRGRHGWSMHIEKNRDHPRNEQMDAAVVSMTRPPSGQRPKKFAVSFDARSYPELL